MHKTKPGKIENEYSEKVGNDVITRLKGNNVQGLIKTRVKRLPWLLESRLEGKRKKRDPVG